MGRNDLFNDLIHGDSLIREMDRALNPGREMERALGLTREFEKALGTDSVARWMEDNRAIDKAMSDPLGAADMMRQYRDTVGLASHLDALQGFSVSQELAEAALRPFSGLLGLSYGYGASRTKVVGRLNKSIANAPVIGEVELKQKQEKEGEEKSVDEAQQAEPEVEPRLVEGAPVEALSQLHRIGFVPLFELDRVLRHPEAMRHLSAREFEGFIATLVEQLGFEDVVLTPPSGDDGRDILATKRFAGMPVFFAFECKKYAPHRPVGPDIIRALLGTVRGKDTRANKGVLVTTSTFTPAARKFFVTEPDLEGRDFDDVVAWLKEYALARRNLGPE